MNSTEARKGFLTFVATLVIAAGIYFSAYVAVNTLNAQATLENSNQVLALKEEQKEDVKGAETSAAQEDEEVTKPSIFGGLVQPTNPKDPKVPAVLAGSDTNQSSGGATPSTGSNTVMLITVVGSFLSFLGIKTYATFRKSAIAAFEKRVSNKF